MGTEMVDLIRSVFEERLIDNPYYDNSKQVVVAVYGGAEMSLQLYLTLNRESEAINTELLERKASVVRAMACPCPEALGKIEAMGLDIKDLVRDGTRFLGASPVKDDRDEMVGIVAVSGQDHEGFDQPASELVAQALAKSWIVTDRAA